MKLGLPWSPGDEKPAVASGAGTRRLPRWSGEAKESSGRPAGERPDCRGGEEGVGRIPRRFILEARVEGLTPAPPAEKGRCYARRTTTDVLPPTPAELALVADQSPTLREVIAHLLARPQYGEKWGRPC